MSRILCAISSGLLMLSVSFPLAVPALASEAPSFKVVSVDGTPDARLLAVRIGARLPQKDLKELALAVASSRKKGEAVANVRFYLPGHELSQDPWATAQIDGTNVELTVLGLRAEDEAQYRAEAQADARDVVGVWITSPPALPGKLTILRTPKGVFMAEWHLRSGQKTTDQLMLSRSSRGQRYEVVGGDGAYYLATWSGPLALGDATRIIAYGEKLVIEKKPASAPVALQTPKPVAGATAAANAATALPVTAAAGTTQQQADGAAVIDATGAEAMPATPAPRPRRAKQAVRAKSRSSVADLMGNSLSR